MKNQEKEITNVSRRKFLASAATLSAFMIVPRFVLGKGFVAPSDKINLGFIGAGKQSMTLRRAFAGQEQAQIVAASDVYKRKLDFFAQEINKFYAEKKGTTQYKGCDVYEDYEEIIQRKDIDAVVIITPDHWHAVQAVAAAKAGKDIYCEKPLSLTIEEGRTMVNATRKYNRVFQTGSMQRSWDEFRQAVALIRGGYIGELDNIKVSVGPPPQAYNLPKEEIPADLNWDKWLGPNKDYSHFNEKLNPDINSFWAKWRDYKEFGGGMVSDWGAHMFDIVQWALNMDHSGPVAVTPPDENHKFLTFEYANGLKMTHENFGINNAIQFNGKEGTVVVQRKKLEVNPSSLQNKEIDTKSLGIYHSTNHYQDFLDAIKNRSKPICDVEIGHRTASVCNIANIAYELKRPLKWNPEKEFFINDQEANELRGRAFKKGFKLT
ncbi:Gfo/Idh/MocA family protein [Pedobacter glucosidilyticus]|uniref:Gfo/Idh/MocA family protein n=1 Tax=Pedobacter glucosidilyticus TaxID=1122941 RepID=UPI0026EF4DC3|nr:Gfo/Idh/MocA family oxidoreductase [Pedobacter glucosidilyticus]